MSLEHSPARGRLRTTRQASAYLQEKYGINRAPAYLAKLRVVGGGPVFVHVGERDIGYQEPSLDAWAESLIGRPMRSTSEAA